MILRRITEHVKAQNWFAVAIDFVIVVVGILIGIQVSNWNSARATALAIDYRRTASRLETIQIEVRDQIEFEQFLRLDIEIASERAAEARAFRRLGFGQARLAHSRTLAASTGPPTSMSKVPATLISIRSRLARDHRLFLPHRPP